ncbi:MAG: ATP-dependent helicase [Clostridiales bacterium]|nr:ATP-dependent helicase [Clostridiales bacterium]
MRVDQTQSTAISHLDGPALILAGPGSGKTTVITGRVRHLITYYRVRPENILVITFSRAAAAEMRERFVRLMDGHSLPVTFGTFHAVYFHILKCSYGYTADNIVREEQRVRFVREFIHRLRLEYDDEAEFVSSILGEISLIKNTGVDLEHYYSSNCGEAVFRRIYRAYQEFLEQNRLIDFDDMLVYTLELFQQRPDILAAWQQKFCYILIDEFQDINQIQYEIIRMLALPENNLFIVGDDDQSIYRFRGARPEIMLNFERDYPDAKRILLDTNYRSGSEIVRMAGNLISHNRTRFEKKIRANAKTGIVPVTKSFQNQREQNLYVIQEIKRLRQENLPFHEIAILFRTNAQPGLLIRQLMEYGLPFVSREHIPDIYDHWIAKDIFTYIQVAAGDRTRASLLKIMNRPRRYLSRESLPYESVDFEVWKEFYRNQGWMVQRLEKLEMDLKVLERMRPYSAINYIRKGIAYEDYLAQFAAERKMPAEDLLEILDEIQEGARDFDTYGAWFAHLEKIKEEWKARFAEKKTAEDAVRLATLHASKGLEFDTVFLVDVDEKIVPYKKAVLDQEVEEERRMFYVGMTRAKNRLYLLHSGQIHNKEMEPSRFLKEAVTAYQTPHRPGSGQTYR